MSILDQLSSQSGDRTEAANRDVAAQCFESPVLLSEIARGLTHKDAALVGDAVEVFTLVAEHHPEHVAPYAEALAALLTHKTTRVRWEAAHSLALVAALSPQIIAARLDQLAQIIRTDKSVIVRDYLVDALGQYARTSPEAAADAFPMLKETLTLWDGKQAGHALAGLANVAARQPALAGELFAIGQQYATHGRAMIQKAAKALIKAVVE
jgi:hypothetical protein